MSGKDKPVLADGVQVQAATPLTPSGSALRATPRFGVDMAVQLTIGGSAYTGRILDLSIGGALLGVTVPERLSVGAQVDVSFTLPELDTPVSARAEVRWVSDTDQPTMGVQFVTGFRAKEVWALGRFLEGLSSPLP